MSFASEVESFFSVAEADAVKIWGKALADAKITFADVDKILKWAAQETPLITENIGQITDVLSGIAAVVAPQDLAAIQVAAGAAQIAVKGLVALSNSINASGGGTVVNDASAVIASVKAVSDARSAVANVASVVSTAVASAKAT